MGDNDEITMVNKLYNNADSIIINSQISNPIKIYDILIDLRK